MFRNLGSRSSQITMGLYGKVYKGKAFAYVDGILLNQEYQIIAKDVSLTMAAKTVTGYSNINGKTFFKRISSDELTDEAYEKLSELGLLNDSHKIKPKVDNK